MKKTMNPLKQFFLTLVSHLYNPYLRSQSPTTKIDGIDYYLETYEGRNYKIMTSLRIRNFCKTPDGKTPTACDCSAKLKAKEITVSSAFECGETSRFIALFCPVCDGYPPSSASLTYFPAEDSGQ